MSIAIACRCGKKFRAKDHLAGRRVKCPACGDVLTIPAAQPSVPTASAPQAAPGERSIFDDLPAAQATSTSGVKPLGPPRARQSNTNVALIAGVAGGGVLVVGLFLMLVTRLLPSGNDADSTLPAQDVVANASASTSQGRPEAPRPRPATPRPAPTRPRPTPIRPTSNSAGDSEATQASDADTNNAAANDDSSGDGSGSEAAPTLSESIVKWHAQESAALRGSVPPEDMQYDIVYDHFSWMCQLLPHLGRDDLYSQLNFKSAWRKTPNFRLAVTKIPEFLNPNDDRHRWEGYPFQGVALTHFVGMSGVEDRRNVLAAELPRSDDRAGVFGYQEVARGEQITDGLGQTIMIIGSGEGIQGPWIQGGGATIRGARQPYFDEISGFGSKGLASRGAMVMFADGSARTLSADMDPSVFRAMCTIHGAETVDVSKWGTPLDRIGSESTPEERAGKVKILEIFVRERPHR